MVESAKESLGRGVVDAVPAQRLGSWDGSLGSVRRRISANDQKPSWVANSVCCEAQSLLSGLVAGTDIARRNSETVRSCAPPHGLLKSQDRVRIRATARLIPEEPGLLHPGLPSRFLLEREHPHG